MWIFTNKAFLSIVVPYQRDVPAGLKGQDIFAVRARRKVDLINAFGKNQIIHESPERDYRWRVYLRREKVAEWVADQAFGIKYQNFKDSIPKGDDARKSAYMGVWGVMDRFQEQATPRPRRQPRAPLFDPATDQEEDD